MLRSIVQFILFDDPIIAPLGLSLLGCHIILCLLLKSSIVPNGPWKIVPSFTAHQIITFVLMIYQSYLGFKYFIFDRTTWNILPTTEDESGGYYMSQLSMGSMLFWDIPVGIVSDDMGDPIMHLHHLGFFLVSAISLGMFSYDSMPLGVASYAPFFFGIIELSSIPLVIVDVFHPKHKEWNEYLRKSGGSSNLLRSLNKFCRISFAILFLLVRGVLWPYVIGMGAIPDYYKAQIVNPDYALPCRFMVGMAFFFTLLQSYWTILILRQILKKVLPTNKPQKNK